MHLPLLPGLQIHVSMPPHASAPSPSVLQSQPPQPHQDNDQHTHPDSTALQGSEVRSGVEPGQKASHQGRRQCGTGQEEADAMQQPSLKQGTAGQPPALASGTVTATVTVNVYSGCSSLACGAHSWSEAAHKHASDKV